MFNIDNFKLGCSQIGGLVSSARGMKPPTEPQLKKLYQILGRDYQELTEPMKHTAKQILIKPIYYDPKRPPTGILSRLILMYSYEVYGKGKVAQGNDSPLKLEKGNMAEPAAIKFLSKVDGVEYEKNDQLFENKWFKGIPDIICHSNDGEVEKIIEVKTSYDLPSFIMAMMKAEDKSNMYEIMGYMDILKCKKGEIVHVLVDMPNEIADYEEKRLRDRYERLELSEEATANRILNRMNDMQYANIPEDLKIFRRPVTLNRYSMNLAKQKHKLAKKWMQQIHDVFTKNNLILPELTDSDNQEDSI